MHWFLSFANRKSYFESFSTLNFNFQNSVEVKLAVNELIWLKANEVDQGKN